MRKKMPALTLKGVPEDVMDRLRTLADRERRSLNKQAILLLERALAEEPEPFEAAYQTFRETRGPSPLKPGDLSELCRPGAGRPVDL